jgi:hypothetical protein
MAESTSILNQIAAIANLGVFSIAMLALGWVLCERYGPTVVFEIGWMLWGVRGGTR